MSIQLSFLIPLPSMHQVTNETDNGRSHFSLHKVNVTHKSTRGAAFVKSFLFVIPNYEVGVPRYERKIVSNILVNTMPPL